jgi:hypothetical protein
MLARRLPQGSRVVALLALFVALVAAGCGGGDDTGSTSAGPDPAALAPTDAAFYGEVVVKPSGELKEDAIAAARKVFQVQDPTAELHRLLERIDESGSTLTFADDIEPWLGERVGGFALMPSGGSDELDFAIAMAIGDRDAFDDALSRLRADGLRAAGSFRGVRYDQDAEDPTLCFAQVDDFYLAGSLIGLRAAIEASRGSSLADAARFQDAVDELPDDALASFYFDPKSIADVLADVPDAPAQAQQALARYADADPFVGDLTVTADEIAFEASGGGEPVAEALGGDSDGGVDVGQLPGDAWLAFATPPLGPIVRNALVSAGVHDLAAQQVRESLGLDLDADLLETLGGLGLFVRGTGVLDLGGGALLQLTDAAAAQRLVTQLEAIVRAGAGVPTQPLTQAGARGFEVQIPQSPQPIVVLAKDDRLAVGYAASSAQDLLEPRQRFDESSAGKAAIDTLGDGFTPSFVLLVPQVATLLRALDEIEVADLSGVLPYVSAYRSLAIGTKRDGDRTTVRVVAALR